MRKLKDWLTGYMQYTSHSEAPEALHFWTGVGTIAGALRRKVWIEELYYSWTPNFYIIFVGPPAIVTKSTTLDIGKSFLTSLQDIAIGPESMTWQALVQTLSDSREDVLIGDSYYPMSCLTFYSSELGSLIDFKDGKIVTVLTDLWDGKLGSWRRETRTQGSISAINPWINIMAATTPSWLSGNLPRSMIDGGFISRCVIVSASQKRRLIPYPSREKFDRVELERLKECLLADIESISMLKGKFRLTEGAYAWGDEWYRNFWGSPEAPLAYSGRKFVHMHKLAMVLSASAGDELTITEDHLSAADRILSAIEADMSGAIRKIESTEGGESLTELLSFVVRAKRVTKTELWRRFMHKYESYKVFLETLSGAVESGFIELRIEGSKEWVVSRMPEGTADVLRRTSSELGDQPL